MIENHIIAAALVFLLAGFVKGTTGLGLPATAVGLLGLMVPPAQAIALTIVPSFVTNLWQAFAGRHLRELLGRFWSMVGGVCFGIWLGSGLLAKDGSGRAAIALGVILALYAALGLSRLQFTVPAGAERWLSPATGAATGLLAAVTGLNVVPAVPYLQATGLERDRLVQTLGLFLTASTVAMAANLAHAGVFQPWLAGMSAASLLPTLAGMLLGQWVRQRVPEAAFRRCFLFGLLFLGAYLALRAIL
jgi:uncharacterized membrane protein YfcA